MTDAELVLKRLAFIETCLVELRTLARPALLETDPKERRFVEHTLQICIQAIQDTASHIVSDERLGEPRTNQELLTLLHAAGWLDSNTATVLRAAIGFRNVLVRGYTTVDLGVVRNILDTHLTEIEVFVRTIRSRVVS
jgi:uncharacterized protein YutE (UPF0331/DUF86 family)